MFSIEKLSKWALDEEIISIRLFGNASGLHDPQSLLDSMTMWIKLVNPLGREVKVAFSPNAYSRKKKVEKEFQHNIKLWMAKRI